MSIIEKTTNDQNVETKTEEILDLGVEIPEEEIIDEEVLIKNKNMTLSKVN